MKLLDVDAELFDTLPRPRVYGKDDFQLLVHLKKRLEEVSKQVAAAARPPDAAAAKPPDAA